jgi:hypothetical protein
VDAVEARAIDDDAAVNRDALAVVAGATAARRDGDAGGVAGGKERAEFGDGAGARDEVGALVVEERAQRGRIPIIVEREACEGIARLDEILRAEESAEFEAEGIGEGGHGEKEGRQERLKC